MIRSSGVQTAFLILTWALGTRQALAADPLQAAAHSESLQALSVHYADGRTSIFVLKDPGSEGFVWTPTFPRIADRPSSKDGLPLEALDLRHTVTTEDVIVTVSLLYGRQHEERTVVATVHVGHGQIVTVDELPEYGVEPIPLSVVPVPLTFTYLPIVTSASALLEVRVDPTATGAPAYKVVLTNRSARAIKAVGFEAYHGDTRVISGRRRDVRTEPLISPGDGFAMTIPLSTHATGSDGTPEWLLWDRLVITFVLWDDGFAEGDTSITAQERALDGEKARQLDAVLTTLRAAKANRTDTTAELRRQLNANPRTLSIGMQQVRDEVLGDLDEFEKRAPSNARTTLAEWLASEIDDFSAWMGRTAIPWSNVPGR